MNVRAPERPGLWTEGPLPANVTLGRETVLTGPLALKRFRSLREDGLVIGACCTMDAVQFAVGEEGRLVVGDYCYFSSVVLLCDLEIEIGNYVVIGWNTAIADSDFHPLSPAERIADAVACSPLGKGRPRPTVERAKVTIEDDVWIGPAATILKGVRIGAGSRIEAGSLVTRSVPPGCRVAGNPARIIEQGGTV